mmetsp:Transcript_82481/g.237135  ORF Transcript_82481/g.237135 Transcript_82481/m.237135 type:complete len:366 (+) Transcript_82481:356-1453(+)
MLGHPGLDLSGLFFGLLSDSLQRPSSLHLGLVSGLSTGLLRLLRRLRFRPLSFLLLFSLRLQVGLHLSPPCIPGGPLLRSFYGRLGILAREVGHLPDNPLPSKIVRQLQDLLELLVHALSAQNADDAQADVLAQCLADPIPAQGKDHRDVGLSAGLDEVLHGVVQASLRAAFLQVRRADDALGLPTSDRALRLSHADTETLLLLVLQRVPLLRAVLVAPELPEQQLDLLIEVVIQHLVHVVAHLQVRPFLALLLFVLLFWLSLLPLLNCSQPLDGCCHKQLSAIGNVATAFSLAASCAIFVIDCSGTNIGAAGIRRRSTTTPVASAAGVADKALGGAGSVGCAVGSPNSRPAGGRGISGAGALAP